MILTFAFSPEIAGGLFHFKKDHAQYSLKPDDYETRTSGPTTAGFPAFAMSSTQQPSNVWRRPATMRSSFT
jgi:hypothetical protein